MYEDKHYKPGTYWYILVCPKTNQVHTGMYLYEREISKMADVQDVGFLPAVLEDTAYLLC